VELYLYFPYILSWGRQRKYYFLYVRRSLGVKSVVWRVNFSLVSLLENVYWERHRCVNFLFNFGVYCFKKLASCARDARRHTRRSSYEAPTFCFGFKRNSSVSTKFRCDSLVPNFVIFRSLILETVPFRQADNAKGINAFVPLFSAN
jgi:hypothetical protein